jgi:hypothetical protein
MLIVEPFIVIAPEADSEILEAESDALPPAPTVMLPDTSVDALPPIFVVVFPVTVVSIFPATLIL